MKNLNLGSIKIPMNMATKSSAILAQRGGGKSYTGAVIAEEFAKVGVPFVVFDPIDVWWGLRVAADGKGKGLPVVVFGIEHADILLTKDMGRLIAREVVSKNISCIISTFGMPKNQQRHLIAEFAEELLNINNTPRHVFIEEAHEFVPQRVFGDLGKTFNAVSNLVVMGRNRGLGVTLLNQRAATINKDVLTQLDNLFVFRNSSPQDRNALREWVEYHSAEGDFKKFIDSLPSLPSGTGWFWSPQFMNTFEKIVIRKRETFHPDREKMGDTFVMPEINSQDIEAFITDFTKKNKNVEIQDKKKSNKRAKLSAATRPEDTTLNMADVTADESSVAYIADKQALLTQKNAYESQLIEKDGEIFRLNGIINKVRSLLGSDVIISGVPMQTPSMQNMIVDSLPAYEKTIAQTIMKHPNIPFSRSQLAVASGKSNKSSMYDKAIARLIKLKLIQRNGTDLTYIQ